MYCPSAIKMLLHHYSPSLFTVLQISGYGNLYSRSVMIVRGLDRSVRALERIGGTLSEMNVEMKKDLQLWYTPLVPFCSNLKSVCLDVANDSDFAWKEVVSNASYSLESLELVGLGTDAEKVKLKASFPNLKSFKLSGVFVTEHGRSFQLLELLLETLGEKLETVSVSSTLVWNVEGEKLVSVLIRSHCPNLTDFVDLCGIVSLPVYRAPLEHYGPQAQRADLPGYRCSTKELARF